MSRRFATGFIVVWALATACTNPSMTQTLPSTIEAEGPLDSDTTYPDRPVLQSDSGFVETFDGNTGLDRFDTGVFHRDDNLVRTTTWTGDHDLACGAPDTQRTIQRDNPSDAFYVCRDHLMTAIGDTSGYSTAWFSPKQTFTDETTVSWDVNVTDLGGRQWWEVAIVPAGWDSGIAECPQCTSESWVPSELPYYPDDSVYVGNGPFGGDFHVHANAADFNPADVGFCGREWAIDLEGCASKTIRRNFTLIDNGDETVTLEVVGQTYTFAGSFPDDGFDVVFKDHNYTPDKDGAPVGHTWHWDNIAIR